MDLQSNSIANMGKRISVEMGTTLKIELKDIELPLHSSIVGLENEKYIIIKAPEPFKRIKHKLYAGNELIVRYISSGTVFAFQTKIVETIEKPLPLIFIEYPTIIQHHDLRNQLRVNCHIPATLEVGEIDNIGCIVDIAQGGCRCLVQGEKNRELIKYDLGSDVLLTGVFPGSTESITIAGVVKNVKRNRKEYDLGIEFDENNSLESKKVVSLFILTIQEFT